MQDLPDALADGEASTGAALQMGRSRFRYRRAGLVASHCTLTQTQGRGLMPKGTDT
jgi:hypothetical protein